MVLLLHFFENPRLFVPAIFIHQWHVLECFLIYFSPIHLQCIQTFLGVSEQIGGKTFPQKKSSVYYFHRFFHYYYYYKPSILGYISVCLETAICNSYHLQDLVFQPDALRPLIPALKKRQCKCLAVIRSFRGAKRGGNVNKSRRFQFDDLDVLKWIHEMHWNAFWEMSIRNSWDMLWLQI